MSRITLIFVLGYLLLSSALLLYLTYGIWGAVPQTTPLNPVAEPELPEQARPKDGSPRIELIDPERVMIATSRGTLRIFGYNFQRSSEVKFDGVPRRTDYIDQNQLVVALVNTDFVAPGTIVVNVTNDDQTSNAKTLLVESPSQVAGDWKFLGWTCSISQAVRLVLLATFIGAFGASIMALQSIADYRGRNKLTDNWIIFYIVRPPVGGGVAFVFYLVIRGGFLAGTEIDAGAATPFGIVAVAALVGMFSDKAILKLNEVFMTLFKADDDRGGKLSGLAIESTTLPDATTGTPYSQQLMAHGGKPPYKWSAAPPPPAGLNLDENTGRLFGTPTAATPKATYTFIVTDVSGATATADLELEVK